jgi:hypothetical protein
LLFWDLSDNHLELGTIRSFLGKCPSLDHGHLPK